MTNPTARTSRRRSLPTHLRPRLQALVDQLGHRAAAAELGVHPETLLALLAGIKCNGSTVALVEHRLSAMPEAAGS